MIIIFTGATSFTGYHFIKELNTCKIKPYLLFSNNYDYYKSLQGNKKVRFNYLFKNNKCFFNLKYGSSKFIELLNSFKKIDIFCHHFAYTKNYNKDNFNLYKSINVNTHNCDEVISTLSKKKIIKYIYTGSYFEPNIQKDSSTKFSNYGISKMISGRILEVSLKNYNLIFYKFLISNPFGKLEDEFRLTSLIIQYWKLNKIFNIRYPRYKRDFIPVSILRKIYVDFILNSKKQFMDPSYFLLTNIQFIKIFSQLLNKYSHFKCSFSKAQLDHTEPMTIKNLNKSHKFYKFKTNVFVKEELSYFLSLITK